MSRVWGGVFISPLVVVDGIQEEQMLAIARPAGHTQVKTYSLVYYKHYK